MRLIASFLIGRRAAILELAGAEGSLWLSAGLVMTAALARRYDQADLLGEPWLLLAPLAWLDGPPTDDESLDRKARALAVFPEGRQIMREQLAVGRLGELERAFRQAPSDAEDG